MPTSRYSPPERAYRKRVRALKKQAKKNAARRKKILAGLNDRLIAALYEHSLLDMSLHTNVPLQLVPSRDLRRRVRQLNLETEYMLPGAPMPGIPRDPAPIPPGFTPEAVREVPSAERQLRPIGRGTQYPLHPVLPMMPDQQATLAFILANGRFEPEITGMGSRYRCPFCPKPTRDSLAVPGHTLRVFPTANGDLIFRCHRCAFVLDSIEFVQKLTPYPNAEQAAQLLYDCKKLSVPTPAAQLAGYERLAALRPLFDEGRRRFARRQPRDQQPILFGDWALMTTASVAKLFPGLRFPKGLPDECLVRISRDVFGRWSSLHLHQPRSYGALYRLELRDWEQPAAMTVFLPAWADAVEGRELIMCAESMVAKTIEIAVGAWPEKDRLPVALIDRYTGTMNEPVSPFSTVWAVTRGTRDARFALPWCAPTSIPGEPTVRVLKLREEMRGFDPLVEACKDRSSFCIASAPECVENMAAIIAAEKDHQPLAVVMADLLGQPGLHPTTRRLLLDAVSARTGLAPDEIVPENFDPWTGGPYALNATGGTTYIAREGRYWRRGSREKDFTAVTNFVVRLHNREIDPKGRVTHQACIEINGCPIDLSLSSAVFDSPKRLLTALTTAAARAGVEYPVVVDSKAKRLLPELIRATHPLSVRC